MPEIQVCSWLRLMFAEENHFIGLCLGFPSTFGETLAVRLCAVPATLKSCSDLWTLNTVRQIQKRRNVAILPLKTSVSTQEQREPHNAQPQSPRCTGYTGCPALQPLPESGIMPWKHNLKQVQ